MRVDLLQSNRCSECEGNFKTRKVRFANYFKKSEYGDDDVIIRFPVRDGFGTASGIEDKKTIENICYSNQKVL